MGGCCKIRSSVIHYRLEGRERLSARGVQLKALFSSPLLHPIPPLQLEVQLGQSEVSIKKFLSLASLVEIFESLISLNCFIYQLHSKRKLYNAFFIRAATIDYFHK